MKLHNLRDFLSVAKSGGIRAAARELNLSQPALSKSISQLERELGTPLFERGARGSTLNAYGERFLVRAEAVMQEIVRGREEITQMRGSTGGSVTIAASSVIALSFLTQSIERFRRSYPTAMIKVHEGTYSVMLNGLRERRLDFAVGPVPTSQIADDLKIENLFRNTRYVVGRRGHPLAKAKSLSELSEASWVMTSVIGPQDDEFRDLFRQNGIDPPKSLLRCESLIALLSILADTDALAFLPRQWATAKSTGAVLTQIPIAESIPGPTTCIIRPNGMPLTPAAEALADAIRAGAANLDS